ncbi:hypothetical protein N7495_000508 [Penicillium taxi]|uniref:uncharacterized protein n=1 Tax=Penicillium taxi TaxID=168475 RepID=UPI0025450F22|nr:uncharacterized protein N7495_000508 [Penicillium taxi]KAJ5907826.1 hypothetical protein N7495_000508 [Penicillium taxi]
MDDLFDVFDAQPADANKKRQSDTLKSDDAKPVQGQLDISTDNLEVETNQIPDNDIDQPFKKRPRLEDAPVPVVADTFESAQERELAVPEGSSSMKVSSQLRHQTAVPPGYDYIPISTYTPKSEPAKTYSFPLDPFQQLAVNAIERNESVLVSAHTSAGKTVCAEYAIAQSLKEGQRVIYTSPIKALSNQKYREFAAEFGDVGLMTGDVTINPTAGCLVMTTEILRSMLYRGSEITREVQWVIFDEVHYLRDKSRGVVWEETLILLPNKVRYVFLSATIPNAMQFAEWICKIHEQPVHVVYTDYRPTPLQHYLFPNGSDGLRLIVDETGLFREKNFQEAMHAIKTKAGDGSGDALVKFGKKGTVNKGGQKGTSDIQKLVKLMITKNHDPLIVFSFSKRDCEKHAVELRGMSFNDDSEKEQVSKVFDHALEMLSPEDRKLPQVGNILPLLRRGIGVHHSGLLPILKEIIEILFQEHLIKVLFATETFSIGLNMPAKTVIFTNVRKWDGSGERWLTSSEFIQMSGRAGRRGLDDRGIVIMMVGVEMDPKVAKEILRGEQDSLNSAFHLGYNMVLNLMRVEVISPEYMLEKCFKHFQETASVSALEIEYQELSAKKDDIKIVDEGLVREYYDYRKQLDKYRADIRSVITHPNFCLQFLQIGRLVHIKHKDQDFGWGMVVRAHERKISNKYKKANLNTEESESQWFVDVLLELAHGPDIGTKTHQEMPPGLQPSKEGENGRVELVPVMLSCIENISGIRIQPPSTNFVPSSAREDAFKVLLVARNRFPDGFPVLDPIQHMNITDPGFKDTIRKTEILESKLFQSPLINREDLPQLYDQYVSKINLGDEMKTIKKKISDVSAMLEHAELKNRKRVLRRLGFINDADVIQLKGRVACEISAGDELMLSELLFRGFFNTLTPEVTAAVLSVFVFEEQVKQADPINNEQLSKPLKEIQLRAREIAKVSQECKMDLNEQAYVEGFHWELMEVVFEWANGKSFLEICQMTQVFEGSLIRVFRRLEECMRQMAQASKVMGSDELESKFETALGKVRRDIVSAQSLYL